MSVVGGMPFHDFGCEVHFLRMLAFIRPVQILHLLRYKYLKMIVLALHILSAVRKRERERERNGAIYNCVNNLFV